MDFKYNVITAFLLLIFSTSVAQGYYNQENFGNRSLLLNGNVTGSVDDLGLTYYNPARIALIDEPAFSINAKAYQVTSLSLKNVFGRDNKLSDSKFQGVPSLLAGTFKIKKWEKHHFAYAFLSKQRSQLDINVRNEVTEGDIINEIPELERLASNLEMNNRETDEWFGGSWGMKIRENFSVGVSAFASVYNFKGQYDLRLATLNESQRVGFYNNFANFSQTSYGMFWKIGLAWKLKHIDFGLNVDLPYLEVIKSGKLSYGEFLSGYGADGDIYEYGDFSSLDSNRKEPLGVSIGAGIPWKKNTIHLKADWHAGIGEYDRLVIPPFDDGTGELKEINFSEELSSVINFGVGFEIFLNDRMNLFASFATDFSPLETNANIFDLVDDAETDVNIKADFMHYGLGVDFKFPRADITVGTTYASATDIFDRPVDFPDPEDGPIVPGNDDPSEIGLTRWRFIVGLEFPIFGYDVNFK